MSTRLDYNLIGQEAEAKEAFSAKSFFGKLNVEVGRFIHWVDNQPVEVDQETFATLPTRDRSLELAFMVDIKEFRPDFEFQYERNVRIGDSDWWKTFRPSVEAIFGEGSMSKGKYATTLENLNGAYVEVNDVPQQKKPEYGTVSIVRVFPSRDECLEAWQERFGSSASTSSNAGVPEGWDAALWEDYKPEILALLEEGKTPKEVAVSYGVEISDIIALRRKK